MITKMGDNAKLYSRYFTAEAIINKYIQFVR